MGNCVSCFSWGCQLSLSIDQEIRYILCPTKDSENLRHEMLSLRSTKEAINADAKEKGSQPGFVVRSDVIQWMDRVDSLDVVVAEVLDSLHRRRLCCCMCSNYVYGERIRINLELVRHLTTQCEKWMGVDGLVMKVRQLAISSEDALMEEMRRLKDVREDFERRVEMLEMEPFMERSNLAKSWMDDVDAIVSEVMMVMEGSIMHDEEIAGIRGRIKDLRDEQAGYLSSNDLVVRRCSVELPRSSTSFVVGLDEMLLPEVLGYLRDVRVQVIGIYGMGGVGKTTLIKEASKRLIPAKFELVIWVEVSQSLNILSIQEDIAIQMGYFRGGATLPQKMREWADFLLRQLSRRKNILLVLDDAWEGIDLALIGIPNNCKIVITTRFKSVCTRMGCQRMLKMGFLGREDSWLLFENMVQNDRLLRSEAIRPLAEEIVRKCGGLPLLLVTVARAMMNKPTLPEWRNAKAALDDFPDDLEGMEEQVLKLLKFSFDNLKSEMHRRCLLYCALFPDDSEIVIETLLEYCIGVGLLEINGYSGIAALRDRGRSVVSDLIQACLLEKGRDDDHVKMHDAIHDMAVWLGRGGGGYNYKHKFLPLSKKKIREVVIDEAWREAEMVSLTANDIEEVIIRDGIHGDLGVTTLLLNMNGLSEHVPAKLAAFLPGLLVLDLSYTSIRCVPESICSLGSLQYLNLSHTYIDALPTEMGKLTNLMQLKLSFTLSLTYIPLNAITTLSKLQFLDVSHTKCFRCKKEGHAGVKDLETLRRLEEVSFTVIGDPDVATLVALRDSFALSRCTKQLLITSMASLTTSELSEIGLQLTRLDKLQISRCKNVSRELVLGRHHFPSLEAMRLTDVPVSCITLESQWWRLRELEVSYCDRLEHLSWLRQLPELRRVCVDSCEGITRLLLPPVGSTEDAHAPLPLSKVEYVELWNLPNLVAISTDLLVLESLTELRLWTCPQLKKLSIMPSRVKVASIWCEKEWWDGLEWDGPHGCAFAAHLK